MHSETYPLLVPLLIIVPALGAFINLFWGKYLGERAAGYLAVGASVLTFIISVLIFASLSGVHGMATVVNAPFTDWIRIDSVGVDFPWQFRVDTLMTVMLLVVSGVGSLIHIYAVGYIHGDPKATRFFAFLNMFLLFMFILVTANNFLMMFVGWEGVGLMSFLLIGFWWDKSAPEGWKNSNAARKAMIVNRIGDFGILMAMFLIFWTFGTLSYAVPGETLNTCYRLEVAGYISADDAKKSHSQAECVALAQQGAEAHSEAGEQAEAATGHGHEAAPLETLDNTLIPPDERGVYGQVEYLMNLPQDSPERLIDLGPFELDISAVLFLILIFLLLGVAGKSAQIPLFVWLPDAMAGPTPVSALMHAATMVTAGVFLLVRSNVFLDYAPEAKFVIAITGALTALVAGYMAAGQWDIKRVLAYSTISQLGFMVAAVGIGAYVAAMFHLVTHAFFKALLFLGSGSVIHGVEHGHHHDHEQAHGHDAHDKHGHDDAFDAQDMRNMGGLASRMPVTFWTYLFGTFALAGLFPFAGFWSKDEILLDALHVGLTDGGLGSVAAFTVLGLLLIAAGFTAFYMWRQIQMVFFGQPRSAAAANAPESSRWMTTPLIVLAFLSLVGGFVNVPYGAPFSPLFKEYEFKHWLESSVPHITQLESLTFNWLLAILATLVAGGAIYLAHTIYAGDKAIEGREGENGQEALGTDPLDNNPATQQAWRIANARMYWDQIYYALFEGPFNRLGTFLADTLDWKFLHDYFHDRILKRGYNLIGLFLSKPLDIGLIDGIVNAVGRLSGRFSGRVRTIQTGYVRTYALALFFGVVAVIIVMLLPLIQNGG